MSSQKPVASGRWDTTRSSLFEDSLARNTVVFKDLPEKLERFIDIKLADPMHARYGKHDGPMSGPFKGFNHAHLRDDAIMIYTLKGRKLNLIYIATHAEVEGKRCARTAERLTRLN